MPLVLNFRLNQRAVGINRWAAEIAETQAIGISLRYR